MTLPISKTKSLSRVLLFYFLVVAIVPIYAQQSKEVFVDFSANQKPDTNYVANKNNKTVTDTLKADTRDLSLAAIDSLKKQVLVLRKDLDYYKNEMTSMQLNLSTFHSKYKKGTYTLAAGVLAYIIGYYGLLRSSANNTPARMSDVYLFLGGLGATVTGVVIMIDSNKYIGRAGERNVRYARSKFFY